MAAAYLYHLVQNHAFIDGNKRIGLWCALVFLDLNGIEIEVPDEDLERLVLDVATSVTDKRGVADFLRRASRKA